MLPDKDIGCHRTGFTRKCREIVVSGECNRFIQIHGNNPNTGEPASKWDCIDNWQPMLLLENSQQQRQTAAAVESFRNEMVRMNGISAVQQSIGVSRVEQKASIGTRVEPIAIEHDGSK